MIEAQISFSAGSTQPLRLWLEPWCDELSIKPRSVVTLIASGEGNLDRLWPEVDAMDDGLIVYGAGGSLLRVLVDGEEQSTASVNIAVPDLGGLSTRRFIDLAFGRSPEAQAHGVVQPSPPTTRSWWRYLLRL